MRAAYAATDYRVMIGEGWMSARLDRPAPEIDWFLQLAGVRSGTFVTAWNPRGRPASAEENARAAAALTAEIEANGWRALPHRGVGDAVDWPPEEGWFVLDLDEARATALAQAYGQNAVVRVERGHVPRLVETEWLTCEDEPSTIG